jgi:hypothetical protein
VWQPALHSNYTYEVEHILLQACNAAERTPARSPLLLLLLPQLYTATLAVLCLKQHVLCNAVFCCAVQVRGEMTVRRLDTLLAEDVQVGALEATNV